MTAASLVDTGYEQLAAMPASVVISMVPRTSAVEQAGDAPLAGVPFAVKDNIDVAGVPTTAACPAFAYTPTVSAEVVQRLAAAGAVPVAKTNMDQFATGLVGTRSPYGTPPNPFDPSRVPGGSSSGSAVAVAHGAVPFALGTDTAGSGRVPAALCGIVGFKPTRGVLSTVGVVPAVRSVDCVSIFARSVGYAWSVLSAAASVALPPPLAAPRVGRVDDVDLRVFFEVGDLLYGGPWVAERYAAVGRFVEANLDEVDPTVASIILGATAWSAVDFAAAHDHLASLRRVADAVWDDVDVLVLPTVPSHPTLADVAADPIGVNTVLGRYTTFANLLDLCAVAVPTGVAGGLPMGVSVLGPAGSDATVAVVAARIHAASGGLGGVTGEVATPWAGPPFAAPDIQGSGRALGGVELAVAGAHLQGMPLHHQLADVGAEFVGPATTGPSYRLYALAGTVPSKPGLVWDPTGSRIDVEVYRLSYEAFGRFVAGVVSPMCVGAVELDDRTVRGFLCEPAALAGAEDITSFGGWRAYSAARSAR